MKRILVFIDWYKPGYKAGGPIRSVSNMVYHLSDKFEFYIVTRNTDYLDSVPYSDIKPEKWIKLSDNEYVYYFSNVNLSFRKMKKIIELTPFDVAYINGVYSFYFSVWPLLLLNKRKNSRLIVAPRGMFSVQTFKAKALKKRIGIFMARVFGLYRNAIFHTTSKSEKLEIINLKIEPKDIFQITNFPPPIKKVEINDIDKKAGELKMVYTARISNEKNTLFALQCLQSFSYSGNIIFNIYGTVYQPQYWDQCLRVISKMPENIQINYLSDIDNHLVSEVLQKHHLLFLPSLGENFGHSILESFTCGRPVIISNKTPWQHLEEKELGWDLELSEPESFARAIQHALDMNNVTFSKMSGKCRDFASKYVDNEKIKNEYIEMLG